MLLGLQVVAVDVCQVRGVSEQDCYSSGSTRAFCPEAGARPRSPFACALSSPLQSLLCADVMRLLEDDDIPGSVEEATEECEPLGPVAKAIDVQREQG